MPERIYVVTEPLQSGFRSFPAAVTPHDHDDVGIRRAFGFISGGPSEQPDGEDGLILTCRACESKGKPQSSSGVLVSVTQLLYPFHTVGIFYRVRSMRTK